MRVSTIFLVINYSKFVLFSEFNAGQKYCRSSHVNTTLDYSYNKVINQCFTSVVHAEAFI